MLCLDLQKPRVASRKYFSSEIVHPEDDRVAHALQEISSVGPSGKRDVTRER